MDEVNKTLGILKASYVSSFRYFKVFLMLLVTFD